MSSACEITGLSEEQIAQWPHIHAVLTGGELPAQAESVGAYSKDLDSTIASHRQGKGEEKRREGLITHLERSLTTRFKGSKLIAFGSSKTGLSLKGGDLDLCLEMKPQDQKKTVKRISGMLRSQGMENVQALTRATVPIVKFIDPRSGFMVDISINNTLAVHNTRLLSTYAGLDKRVSELAKCIKHWALHRNLSDAAEGTLSSYAWSLLAIQHLQMEGLVPNIQAGKDRTFAEVEGKEFDLTMDTDAKANDSKVSLAELVTSFFHRYSNWDWFEHVVSIRNGSPLTRESKGWMNDEPSAISIITTKKEKPGRMGAHHLCIEDPFNLDHDLCRVVRPEGEMRIRDELIRAGAMLANGTKWSEICATVDPERLANLEPDDLFHDLRSKPDDEVKNMRDKVASELDGLEMRIQALEDERQITIRKAKAMRGIIEETSDLRKEHKSTIQGLSKRNKEIDSTKSQRDIINSNIVIPFFMIEDELSKVYKRLTTEIDIHRVPSLSREKEQFSWFFELQAMHAKGREASELHQRFIQLVKEQKGEIKKLKIFETKHDKATAKLLKEEPLLKDKDISSNEARSYDRRVVNIQKALRARRGELHKLRREAGRLDAWLRKKSGGDRSRGDKRGDNRGRGKGKGRGSKSPRDKAPSSGPMTLGDISGLLSAFDSTGEKKEKKKSSKKAGMRKLGNLGAHRGKRGSYKKKE
jgi:DNA polymerase sigma